MNKKLVIVIAAVLILLLGGFLVFRIQKNKSSGNSLVTNGVSGGVKSLKDLISAGIPQKCIYSTKDDTFSSEGTTYISGGKVRGDFTTVTEGKSTISHMISDNKTSYIWTEGEKTGFKMTVSDTEPTTAPAAEENGSQGGEADLNQKYDYKCSAWVPDSSKFDPPSNVEFSDFSKMFNPSSVPASGSTDSTQCSVCNSLTGDDKSQCLSALKCK